MKRIVLFIFGMLVNVQLESQEIINLPFNNDNLNYLGPEEKKKSLNSGNFNIMNISKPTLEVFIPDNSETMMTAMIICPGGAMRANAIKHEGYDVARALNKKGIAAFVLKYRLVPSHLLKNIKGLDNPILEKNQLIYGHLDALNAIKFVRESCLNYKIDPNKIGIMGFSAGGAVAIEAAYKSGKLNHPDFLALIYPWMVIVDPQSPPSYGPPLFIVSTTEDKMAAIPSTEIYIDWAKKDLISELHIYNHGKHGFGMMKKNLPVDNWFNNMVKWIDAIGMTN